MDTATTPASEISSRDVNSLRPDDDIGKAVALMRDKAIRRFPVVENGNPVGVVSLGDLVERLDPSSVLGQISSAPANH